MNGIKQEMLTYQRLLVKEIITVSTLTVSNFYLSIINYFVFILESNNQKSIASVRSQAMSLRSRVEAEKKKE